MSDNSLALFGGTPVRTAPWLTYDHGDVMIDESDVLAAERVVRSRLLFRYDQRPHEQTEVGKFEAQCVDFFGSRFALATASGTTAIALALMGLGIGEGDVVVCPTFTFPATPSAVKLVGAQLQLVDVDEELNFDLDSLRANLHPRLRAIVVVHMRGVASNIEQIVEFAREHDLLVVEDAVPVFGVTHNGRKLGTFGDVGAFSTQSDKALNTGEGGLVITDDQEVFERMCVLAGTYEGRLNRHFPNDDCGPHVDERTLPILSWRMDEIRAAVAANQLAKFDERRDAAQRNFGQVAHELAVIPGLRVRECPSADDGVAGDALILTVTSGHAREAAFVSAALREEGIPARCLGEAADGNSRCFWNWLFCFPGNTEAEIKALAPRSVGILETAIDIPLSPLMTETDRRDLVGAVRKVMEFVHPSLASAA